MMLHIMDMHLPIRNRHHTDIFAGDPLKAQDILQAAFNRSQVLKAQQN